MTESFPIRFGRYELLDHLAIGGMADLFLARAADETGDGELVVVKRLFPHLAKQVGYPEMFLDEARLTARMTHPKIARTYEFGHCDGALFMAMELVDGIDALAMLRECALLRRRMSSELAVFIAREVLDALDFAHNQVDDSGTPLGVVHRDISPSNVIISQKGEVKLVDFGIAWATRRSHHTQTGILKGKYGYLSPEQILFDDVDARSDLFSVGVLLAELLIGRRLFSAPRELDVLLMVRDVNLGRLDRHAGRIESDLDEILRKALRKRPEDRFATAAEFRAALDGWMSVHARGDVRPKLAKLVRALYQRVWARRSGASDSMVSEVAAAANAAADDAADDAANDAADDAANDAANDAADGAAVADEDGETRQSAREWAEIHEPTLARRAQAAAKKKPSTDHDEAEPGDAPVRVEAGPGPGAGGATSNGVPAAVGRSHSAPAAPAVTPGNQADTRGRDVEPEGVPDASGDFSQISPIRLLYQLATSNATGLLSTSVGGIRKRTYLRRGTPTYVSSNVFSERFGEYLVQQGILFPGELSMALAVMPRFQNRLGEALVSLSLLSPLDMLRHLTLQVRKKLVDVCTWTVGTYVWHEGRESPRDAFPLDLNAYEILGAGALALPRDAIEPWLQAIGDTRLRLESAGRMAPQTFQLGPALRSVCRALDGTSTVAELHARFAERDEHERFARLLYLLVETGLAVAV